MELNNELETFGISPVKQHSSSSHHLRSEGKRKAQRVKEKASTLVQKLHQQVNICSTENKSDTERKAENFDEITGLIKKKIEHSDKRTVVQLLTLAPPSWKIPKVMETYSVTEYQARKA